MKVPPSPKLHTKFEPAGLVLVNVTACGAQPVVGLAVNDGTGSGRIVICLVVLPVQPDPVFCEVNEMVYVPGAL